MMRRPLAILVAALTGLTGVFVVAGGVAVAPLPAGAAPQPLELEMEAGSGILQIRDAEEAYELETPTTLTGTIDDGTGLITGADLDTPDIYFEQPIEGLPFNARVTASFSPVTPGSTTGQFNAEELSLQTSLKVDLHIEVPEAALIADCVASPVNLDMTTTSAYDRAGTKTVSVADANFTIPAVQETATCSELIVERLNPILAGSGHSLALTLGGDLPEIFGGDTETVTTLTADPSTPISLGEEVELTATVASNDAEVTDARTGTVKFSDGDTVIGTAAVADGQAVLTTSSLTLGDHQITARYSGDSVYLPSTSAPVTVTVQADPVVETEIPPYFTVGGDPIPFDVDVDNPSVGRDINNVRVDVTIKRYSVTGSSFDRLDPADVLLEVKDGNDWEPVTLATVPAQPTTTLAGSLGPELGRALAAGAPLDHEVRLSFPNVGFPETVPGDLDITFDVVEVNPGTGDIVKTLSSTTGRTHLYRAGLIPSITALDADFATVRPEPVRQYGTIGTRVYVGPLVGFANYPSGTITVAIDGQKIPFFATTPGDLTKPNQMSAPIESDYGNNAVQIPLPGWVGPGTHQLTVSYSGNSQFTPSSTTTPITVIEPIGTPYLCEMPVLFENRRFTAQLNSSGKLPSVARSGSSVGFGDFSLDIVGSLDSLTYYGFDLVKNLGTGLSISMDIGPEGSGSASDMTITPNEFPFFETTTDLNVALEDEEASLTVAGELGSTIVPTLERVTLSSTSTLGSPLEITCEPLGDPITYSPVTVAGTALAVDAADPARAGQDVTLTASVFPSSASGTVRFYDGDDVIDVVPVTGGQAVSTVQLDEGQHSLTARSFLGASAPSTVSAVFPLTVGPATDCDEFTDPGNGAAVRLVYLELLRRCPGPAGYEYWVDRLDDGMSRESFAREISISLEARKIIVDDAYQIMLERPAEPAAREFWGNRLKTGRFDVLLADLAASSEFRTLAGGTNEGFINRVYERILGRAADPDGRSYWMYQLNSGVSRRALVLTLANLSEPLGVFVDSAYAEILGRAPSSTERQEGIVLLQKTGNRSHLYARLIGHDDFFERAQDLPNPED